MSIRRHSLVLPALLVVAVAAVALESAGCGGSDGSPAPPDSGPPADPKPDASTPRDGGSVPPPDAGVDGARPDAGPHAAGWDLDYALPGMSGENELVSAIAVFGNRQIAVAGNFQYAGSVAARNVAMWNGDRWLALGSGIAEHVETLAATPAGELYATVDKASGETSVSAVLKWDKTAWTEIAVTTEGTIESIDVAKDGTLLVAGGFKTIAGKPFAGLAKLAAGAWAAVGPALPDGYAEVVRAVGTTVCIGGGIDDTGFGVQCTDGVTWSARKANLDRGGVHTMADMNGKLVIGGEFSLTGATSDDGGSVAIWNGTAWELVGGGVTGSVGGPGNVNTLTVSGTKIYVAGHFPLAGGSYVNDVAGFDTATRKWSDLTGGIRKDHGVFGIDMPIAFALATDSGGEVYIGGMLTVAGERNTMSIARWDGSAWNPVDDPNVTRLGINGIINTVEVAADESVYVGGGFSLAGGDVRLHNVARLSGNNWTPVGAGLTGNVYGLKTKDKDLFAVGTFQGAIQKFDGTAWSVVGGGLDGAGNVVVRGPDGRIYVGGGFTHAGTTEVNRIAAWDGQKWAALGAGVDDDVRAIDFGADGKLYVGGLFEKAGGAEAKHVAVWDGTAWKPLGAGVDDAVDAITSYAGKITIGGQFEKSGTDAVPHLAAWDGAKWTAVGGGLSSPVSSTTLVQGLAVNGNALYAVGLIEQAGTVAVSHLARWDGTAWSSMEGGLNDIAEDVVATKDSLWVAGTFSTAGGRGSVALGRYWFSR